MHKQVELILGNSYSFIRNLTPAQEKHLRKSLSYIVGGKSAYYTGYGPRTKSLIGKKMDFPTGLLKRVISTITKFNVSYAIIDKRICPKPQPNIENSLNLIHKPYFDQTQAAKIAIQTKRGTICFPTGCGKSLLIALIASRLHVKTLVVVPSLEIKKQLSKTLLNAFKDTSWITVENIDSTKLKTCKHYDCLIIDEAHHVAAKTYQNLNKTVWGGIYYRFFLTATPFRNDEEETLLFESIAGDTIYDLSYKQAIDRGYIVPVDAFTINIPLQQTDAYTYAEVYSALVVKNAQRNSIIAVLLRCLADTGGSVLCLVKEVAHGRILSDLTGIPFTHGEDDETRKYIEDFNSNKLKILIGTTGILGEGIDTKPCEYVIIAGLGKAKSQFMQQVGRGVRRFETKDSCKVILFKDKSHKFLLRHYKAQITILKQVYGIKSETIVDL